MLGLHFVSERLCDFTNFFTGGGAVCPFPFQVTTIVEIFQVLFIETITHPGSVYSPEVLLPPWGYSSSVYCSRSTDTHPPPSFCKSPEVFQGMKRHLEALAGRHMTSHLPWPAIRDNEMGVGWPPSRPSRCPVPGLIRQRKRPGVYYVWLTFGG